MSKSTRLACGLLLTAASLGLLAGCGSDDGDEEEAVSEFTDLVLTLLQAPDCAALGEEIGDRIQCQVTNVGNKGYATEFSVRIYVAEGDPFGTNIDFPLPRGIAILNGIGAGDTITFTFPGAVIGENAPVRTDLYTIQADFLDQVSESDRDNNFAFFELTTFDPMVSGGCGGAPLPALFGHSGPADVGIGRNTEGK